MRTWILFSLILGTFSASAMDLKFLSLNNISDANYCGDSTLLAHFSFKLSKEEEEGLEWPFDQGKSLITPQNLAKIQSQIKELGFMSKSENQIFAKDIGHFTALKLARFLKNSGSCFQDFSLEQLLGIRPNKDSYVFLDPSRELSFWSLGSLNTQSLIDESWEQYIVLDLSQRKLWVLQSY